MLQRIVTGVVSAALLIGVMLLRGWVFDIAVMLVMLLGIYEMQKAFVNAGLTPAKWTAYGIAVLVLPIYLLTGAAGIYMLACGAGLIMAMQIVVRKHPVWPDAAASMNVLIGVVIPLSMLFPLIRIQPDYLGALLVFSVFVIALVGDIFAYFVGVAVGKTLMAPELSPKKTWEGSAAGLLGSVTGALLLGWSGNLITPMPPLWHFLILGLVGGVAGQLGDLTASLVKRYCGIKDFGTIFPGHGGMMDRLDSVIFVIYVVFGYCMVTGLLW